MLQRCIAIAIIGHGFIVAGQTAEDAPAGAFYEGNEMCADNEGKCGCGVEAAQSSDGCGCGCAGGEGGAPSKDEKTFAMLAHLLAIFTAFIGPLVIYLVKKDESAFIAKQSKEALNFSISICVASFVLFCAASILVLIPFLGIILFSVLMLAVTAISIYALVMYIVAALKANDGLDFEYPYTLRLVK